MNLLSVGASYGLLVLVFQEQIQKLISYDKDIVSGIYKTENGQNFACVKDWDQEFYKKHGSFYFLQQED
jgi:hypothetical protein